MGFLKLLEIDLKRTVRDLRYTIFIIILPVVFYLTYTQLFNSSAQMHGTTWANYSMVSLAAFGVIGNAITFLGTKLAHEKGNKWYSFLKVSPIPEYLYNVSRVITLCILSAAIILILFAVGYGVEGVRLPASQWISIFLVLLLGSVVFASLALIIGCFKSAAQPIGTMLYLILSFIGGLWMPVEAMPSLMQNIAKFTPTYHYAKLAWDILGNKAFPMSSLLILVIYTIFFLLVYGLILKLNRGTE
ncbi:ABC transporter permease [Priestia megaterium]|uniref:ABC transporter permease n=1 Tax=Priestia megaterium TaxID=1404 RepID=UPI00234EEB56|nr:ABC transporter permease [Priestia megaterium]MDC7772476.1 ABC transporter permease [Priestia megaterium]